MRRTRHVVLLLLCLFSILTLRYLYDDRLSRDSVIHKPPPPDYEDIRQPPDRTSPLSASTDSHPIQQLIADGERRHAETLSRQSQTLDEAVAEYRRRYALPPPPNFDQWFAFARSKKVTLIDDYDTIHHSLLPFWALNPATIRGRTKEALGFADNFMMGVTIRDGKVFGVTGDSPWLQTSITGMLQNFVQYLPDMDLAFNQHDEPRVVLQESDLSRLVAKAKDEAIPAVRARKNAFSPRPADVDDGTRYHEFKTTRFNRLAHQPTWTISRMSCSPQSPARRLDERIVDDVSQYTFSELGFISNTTAFSDICLSPSLQDRFGLFSRPNAVNIVHDLFPVFSQSKVSSYQDILYPSPWYWADKAPYTAGKDKPWDDKADRLYWRGSTTGGFSRAGSWRRQHRQLFVGKVNALDEAKIMEMSNTSVTPEWHVKTVPRPDYKDLFDVQFSHVGQCDPGDCDAQKEYFDIAKPDEREEAYKYKYVLDLDGNAFSGRFYSFLQSMSLVFKMAIFQEWHQDWLQPWVHFIPLGQHGDEYLESIRFFNNEPEGKLQANKIAMQGRDWAEKTLRKDDLEVWLFRLMLEYARLIDDDRDNIGYGV